MFVRVSSWLGLLNSSINWIVLGAVNKNYRNAYCRIISIFVNLAKKICWFNCGHTKEMNISTIDGEINEAISNTQRDCENTQCNIFIACETPL